MLSIKVLSRTGTCTHVMNSQEKWHEARNPLSTLKSLRSVIPQGRDR